MAKKTTSAATAATATENTVSNVSSDVFFEVAYKAALEKDKAIPLADMAEQPLRPLGPTHLVKGDCFKFGATSLFKDIQLSDSASANSKNGPVEVYYLLVQMLDPKTGASLKSTKRLYLNALQRTIYEWTTDDDGKFITTKRWFATSGTATAAFHDGGTVAEGLKALIDKPIKVTDETIVNVRNFKQTELEERRVFQFDFID